MADHISTRTQGGGDQVDLSQRVLKRSEFGKRLYNLMLDRGMNQSDLARASGLGRDSISTYVRGKSVPTPQNLEKLAASLKVQPDELYPNYAANAAALDEPVLQIKQVDDGGDKMWLNVNMKVDAETAIAVMQLLKANK